MAKPHRLRPVLFINFAADSADVGKWCLLLWQTEGELNSPRTNQSEASSEAESPLAEGAMWHWQMDADLAASEQRVRAWRKRESSNTTEFEQRIQRIDPPDGSSNGQSIISEADDPMSVPEGAAADSIVSVLICELMAIAALMVLLFIEAQHNPHFVKFAGVALIGAAGVLMITVMRWNQARRKTASSVSIPTEEVLPQRPPSSRVSPTIYHDLASQTRPAGWN